jgi:hypothetical protein
LNSEALKVKPIETLIQIVAALLVDAELSCDDVWWRVQGCDDLCKKISRQNRCLSTLFPTSSLQAYPPTSTMAPNGRKSQDND